MSDTTVAEGDEVQSPEADAAPADEAPAIDYEAQATEYKNRFAGSQRKLTEELNARKAAEQELEALRTWKAEKERADMTEVERLKAEIQDARNEAAAARSAAEREKLARKFPHAFDVLGEKAPLDEEVLTALEARLGDATEPEPAIDPNHPRKGAPVVPETDPLDPVNAWLKASFGGN